jgi:histone deacetylase 1/2
MKPLRMRLAHNLIGAYGLLDRMNWVDPVRLPREEMVKFHEPDYIDFLAEVTPMQQQKLKRADREAASDSSGADSDGASAVSGEELAAIASRFKRFGVDGGESAKREDASSCRVCDVLL